MTKNFNLVNALFNRAEQTAGSVNNYQINAYNVRIYGNRASIDALCINEYGGIYGTNDVRTIYPSKKQLDRLLKLGEDFWVYED